MKHIEKNKPWIDRNNKPLPIDALRIASKTWDLKTWEEYLKTLELEPDRSVSISPQDFDQELANLSLTKFNEEDSVESDLVSLSKYDKGQVRLALSDLTTNQAEVIKLLYFKGVTLEETSKRLRTSSSNILQIRDRALANLRKNLSVHSTASEGGM